MHPLGGRASRGAMIAMSQHLSERLNSIPRALPQRVGGAAHGFLDRRVISSRHSVVFPGRREPRGHARVTRRRHGGASPRFARDAVSTKPATASGSRMQSRATIVRARCASPASGSSSTTGRQSRPGWPAAGTRSRCGCRSRKRCVSSPDAGAGRRLPRAMRSATSGASFPNHYRPLRCRGRKTAVEGSLE